MKHEMRLTIAYSKIKKRNLVLINNDTHQRETVSERPIRPPLSLRMLYDILNHHGIVTCRLCHGLCASVDLGGRWRKAEIQNFPRQGGAAPWTPHGPVNNLDPRPFPAAGSAPGWVLENGVLWEWGPDTQLWTDVSLWLMITWVVVLEH